MNILENTEPRLGGGRLVAVNQNETEITTFLTRLRMFSFNSIRIYFICEWFFIRNKHYNVFGRFFDLFRTKIEHQTTVTIMLPPTEENHNALRDMGYEITDNDEIEWMLICPKEFDDDVPTLVEFILDYEQWTKIIDNPNLYAGQKLEVAKRELSKILCEFCLPIVDGR